MKTLLFTKSAGLIDGALEEAGVAAPSTPSTAAPSSNNLEDWFTRNRDIIGAGVAGLGSGALLTGYILKKMHEKEIKKLKQENKNQKEENNKTE